ncbi:MAG TPA: phosphatase PAP2 family protein [Candidatus Dormibacteraeota bacterium]
MPQASVSSALHDLAGRSAGFDDVVRFAAQDLLYVAALLALVVWLRPQGLRAGVAAGGGALIALVTGALIGAAWDRPRPFVAGHYTPLFAHANDASFPSDHLLALGAFAAAAWLAWRPVGLAAVLLAVAVGVARVIAGVHYAGDVVGGFLIGAVAATLVWIALTPVLPQLDRIDEELRRLRLRPRVAEAGGP